MSLKESTIIEREFSGKACALLRKESKLKQILFAKKLGIKSQGNISQYENGEKSVTLGKFMSWCETLDIDASKIISKIEKS